MSILHRKITDITIIVVHCSDSDNPAHDDISVIREWHMERGWEDVGYHYLIQKSGKIQIGRSLYTVGAHVNGHNFESIGICLSGKKDFTEEQFKTAARIIDSLYTGIPNLKPKYGVLPHRFLDSKKTCPNFEMSRILTHIDPAKTDIDRNGKYL